jgi:hypothetical protein
MPDQVCVNLCFNEFLSWSQTWNRLHREGIVPAYHYYAKEALAACTARCEQTQDEEEDDDDDEEEIIPRRPDPILF